MAAKKFLRNVSGRITEITATVTSAGAGNDGDIVALDSAGKLDSSVLPAGIGAATKVAPASEDLTAGNLVSFWNDGGTLKVRKADATAAGKEAHGFVLANVNQPANATVYFPGQVNTGVSGLTLGSRYYLNTTAGGVTATAPSATSNIVQAVGIATATTELLFMPEAPITVA
jgi:hypothetical protein